MCPFGLGSPQVFFSWWRHQMETFAALVALCVGKSPVTGEFPSQRPVMRSFDVFFDLHFNKRLSKQLRRWWSDPITLTVMYLYCIDGMAVCLAMAAHKYFFLSVCSHSFMLTFFNMSVGSVSWTMRISSYLNFTFKLSSCNGYDHNMSHMAKWCIICNMIQYKDGILPV